MINLMALSKEERIQRLILEVSRKHSLLNQIQSFSPSETGILTEDEIYYILSKVEHRIYFITDSPTFEFESKALTCSTMKFDNISDLIDGVLKMTENDYFIFYNVWLEESHHHSYPTSSTTRYVIRGNFQKDHIEIRNNKIDEVLGK